MKQIFTIIILISTLFVTSCSEDSAEEIQFVTAAEYPPFEYMSKGELKGYDIDLAKLIAKKLNKQAKFTTVQFSSILPALSSKQVDVAISTISITEDRKKNFDFTDPYYFEGIAAVFPKDKPILNPQHLQGKKVAAQLGTTMEYWLKKQGTQQELITLDNNNQAVTALKNGVVEVVVMDGAQGAIFSKVNPGLSYAIIAKADEGYGLALNKHNPLTQQINKALHQLQEEGELIKLKKKWLENSQWKN